MMVMKVEVSGGVVMKWVVIGEFGGVWMWVVDGGDRDGEWRCTGT